MPFAGSSVERFLAGALVGYALKKAIKIAGFHCRSVIATLAYLEFQRIIDVNWAKLQAVSQNVPTWVANTIVQISNNIGAVPYWNITRSWYPVSQVLRQAHVTSCHALINFQKLFGTLTKSRENRFFDDIIGHEHIKRLTRTESCTPRPPRSAKTLFLMSF